jgi:hypothetical protein
VSFIKIAGGEEKVEQVRKIKEKEGRSCEELSRVWDVVASSF